MQSTYKTKFSTLCVIVGLCFCVEIVSAQSSESRRNIGIFFDKLRAGKTVTVAFMGGAEMNGVGAGNPEKHSYRALICEYLRKKFPRAKIIEINASVPNTGTLYAAMRARRDVLAFKPDLVFLDFTVADVIDLNSEESSVRKGVEGLVRQLLIVPQPPEVVMLYSTVETMDLYHGSHDDIADHYSIPTINLQNELKKMVDDGKVSKSEIWKDSTTPNDAGHKLFAGIIADFLFAQSQLKPDPIVRHLPLYAVSDEMNYGEFKAAVEIKHNGTWHLEPVNDRTLPSTLLVSDKVGTQIEYYFEGTVIGLSFRMGPDCGMFEVLIDGKRADAPLGIIDAYHSTHIIGTRILAGGLGVGEHKLTIRILPDKNAKSLGRRVRLGYVLIGGARPERL